MGLLKRLWAEEFNTTILLKDRLVENPDDAAAISSLKDHPGFTALVNRFRLQRAVLETRLNTVRHKDIREVDFLQSGLTWLGYLENECERAAKVIHNTKPEPASYDEMAEFDRINSFLERVGVTPQE